jgi:hypothetical protein
MSLFSKKKEQELDIEEIRKGILPSRISMPLESLPKQFPELEKFDPRRPELPLEMPEKEEIKPLFVRLDDYREVMMHVRDLKVILTDLKRVVELHKSIEDMRTQNLKLLERVVDQFSGIADSLDNRLIRPELLPSFRGSNINRMDRYIAELEEELKRVKLNLGK